MAYDPKLKANSDIFEKIRFIDVQDVFVLSPIKPEILDVEAKLYLVNSKNEGVKNYIPTVYADNENEAKEKLLGFIDKMLFKASILYCIRLKSEGFPIGYIHLSSPLTQSGLDTWMVDFWLAESFQKKGIMAASLSHLLMYLESMEVVEVCAVVDPENHSSIGVLEKIGFQFEMQEKTGEGKHLYSVQLQ